MNPSYIATNTKELFDQAPADIKTLLTSGEVKRTTATLVKIHNIPVGVAVRLSNIITLILIGALQPSDVVRAITEMLSLKSTEATALAQDLEKSILQKARIALLHQEEDVKVLEFKGERSPDDLRKEILDTTKRESAITKEQILKTVQKKTSVITPGSRSQLLEQLQILGSIPNDEEVNNRLKHIQEQIRSIKKQEDDNSLTSNIALKSFMFGEKGKELADPKLQTSTYSTAPTHYNVDPYREIGED